MAVTDLGIVWPGQAHTEYYGTTIRIDSTSTPSDIIVRFVTQQRDIQRYITADFVVETVPNSSSIEENADGYGGWWGGSSPMRFQKTFDVSNGISGTGVWVSDRDEIVSGYLWNFSLDFTSEHASTVGRSIRPYLHTGSTWSFASRFWDAVHIRLKIRTTYNVGGSVEQSDWTSAECYIGYIPRYIAQRAYYRNSGLVIDYTSPNWDRSTDRWEAITITQNGEELVPRENRPWGSVRSSSRLVIPAAKLKDHVVNGVISGKIRMNASWRPSGLEFATMTLNNLQVEDQSGVSTPTLTLVNINANGRVVIDVGDSGDISNGTPASVKVKLKGHYLPCDTIITQVGSRIMFYPPIGQTCTIVAVGYDSTGEIRSARASLEVFVNRPTTGAVFASWAYNDAVYGGTAQTVMVPYGWTLSESGGPMVETVKLAGRERPSAFFGEGGTRSMTFSGVICTESGHGMTVSNPDLLRELAEAGVMLYRDDQGHRAWVSAGNVNFEHTVLPPWLKRVSIDMEEVSS